VILSHGGGGGGGGGGALKVCFLSFASDYVVRRDEICHNMHKRPPYTRRVTLGHQHWPAELFRKDSPFTRRKKEERKKGRKRKKFGFSNRLLIFTAVF
jgi:hypothetical protein